MHEHDNTALIADQPDPVPTEDVAVWDLVLADMKERDGLGRQRYGTPLQVENGRNHLIDMYQEMLDGVAYIRAEIERRNRALPLHSMQLDHAIRQTHKWLHGEDTTSDPKMWGETPCHWLVEAIE